MTQSSTEFRVQKRIGFQYVACVAGLAIAIGALVALGSLKTDPGPAARTATRPASVSRTVEVPTMAVYLVASDQQADMVRNMESELDYYWNESRETRPPRSFQIFVADTPAGEEAANRTLAELFEVAATPSQLWVDVLDLRR